ncbi:MAG: hypothetical protein JKX93_00340 [Rhizobiaceae bacterium]|nr:hypothetical protein [Rhizobiaceae bacterium]MBL4697170.1 hypothetical protein [Rhizobiaceae bacterium]
MIRNIIIVFGVVTLTIFATITISVFDKYDTALTKRDLNNEISELTAGLSTADKMMAQARVMNEVDALETGTWSAEKFDPSSLSSKIAARVYKLEKKRLRGKAPPKPITKFKQSKFGTVKNTPFTRAHLASMERMTELVDSRYISVSIFVPRSEFKNSDGIPVPDAELKNSLKSQIKNFSKRECSYMQIDLADKCSLSSTRFWRMVFKENGVDTKYIKIVLYLNFTQKDDLGSVDTSPILQVNSTSAIVLPEYIFRLDPRKTDEVAATKIKAYKKMVKLCRGMRQLKGHCAITGASITSSGIEDRNIDNLYHRSTVDLGVLQSVEQS